MSYTVLKGGLATLEAPESQRSSAPRADVTDIRRFHQLELKVAALQKDYAEVHTALVEAAQIHRRLCAPRLVRYGNFDIASETFAVRHVPGDFFTVKETNDGIILALCDICGKGLGAGMWTTHLVGLVDAHSTGSSTPEEIARCVNADLCRLSSVAPMASFFLAKLEPASGKLDYCNAGHPPALLLRADGTLETLSEGGPVLGVLTDAYFARGSVELKPGDILLACSDGVLESANESDQEFGYQRLEAELRHARKESAETLLFSVLGAVQDFAAARPLVDDMTLMVLRHR